MSSSPRIFSSPHPTTNFSFETFTYFNQQPTNNAIIHPPSPPATVSTLHLYPVNTSLSPVNSKVSPPSPSPTVTLTHLDFTRSFLVVATCTPSSPPVYPSGTFWLFALYPHLPRQPSLRGSGLKAHCRFPCVLFTTKFVTSRPLTWPTAYSPTLFLPGLFRASKQGSSM